jgi:hypothetical protein
MNNEMIMTVTLGLAVTWTMLFAGTRKKMLALKSKRRRCPSCGHTIDGRVCGRHSQHASR